MKTHSRALEVKAPGVIDVTVWEQEHSMTVHLVNLTNSMMMKGPFRELIPVDAEVTISIPAGKRPAGVHLLISGKKPIYKITNARPDDAVGRGKLQIKTPQVMDHEIIGVDFA